MKWLKQIREKAKARKIQKFEAFKEKALSTENRGLLKRLTKNIPYLRWQWTNNNGWSDYAYTIELDDGFEMYVSHRKHNEAAAGIIQEYIDYLKQGRNDQD